MRTKTLVMWGGIGLAGYLLYRYITKTAASMAPKLAPSDLNRVTDQLTSQIDAGTYNAQGQRLAGLRGYR